MSKDTNKTILLVEDEAIISIVVTRTLKSFGYNVLTAGSGEKAVELSSSNDAIDLILMDIDLGTGIDGTEAAKQILEFRDLPIVFHTSHSEREMVDRVRGITRYGYVIKSSGDFVLQSSIEMAFELVEAHKKVKANEEHFYSMFEKAPLGYQSLDENGCFLEINQKWVETLGYRRDEVVGRWFGDFLAPEFVDAFRERFPVFKAEGKIHSEFQIIHKNGSRRYIAFEGRVGYQDDGSFKQTHCILSDDTERKSAEDALSRSEEQIKNKNEELSVALEEMEATNEELSAAMEEMEATNEELISINERLIQSEREVQRREELFRSLAESTTDYIMVYDKEKRHVYANPATLKGSNATWDEFIGRTHRDLGYDPVQFELWEEKIQKVFDTGESQRVIFDWEAIDGTVTLDWRVTPIFAEDGRVDKVLGVSRDISEIKRAEEKIKTSEDRFSAALAAVDDGIWDWHVPDGKAYFNWQYYKTLGYEDNEFGANYDSWRLLVHPEDIDRVEADLKNSTESSLKFNIDLRMKMKSGEWLWVCIRGKVVETDSEGKALRMVGTISDVTLRKTAEFELRKSQDNLARIIENSSELICEIDEKGKYTFVSKRYKDVLGYRPDELIGRHTIEQMYPDDIDSAKLKFIDLKSENGVSVNEWRFRHKNGSYHTFECRSSVYRFEDGCQRMVVISHDITESKQIEDAQLFLIMSGSHQSGGDDFFQSLARYLAETLKMDFVCIDKFVGGGLSAQTVAVYFDGEFEDNIEYTLDDTPCGVVAGKTICTFEENVRGLFPKDKVLQDMKAESYAGVTLWGSNGEPIGLIAVIGREKMVNPRLAESILKMVAIRAAGELERREAEEKIKNLLLEKDILLKEVHHRIKNNMNTINGLLSLQADSLTDPAAVDALKDAESRVQSMMVLYDKLYRSDNFNEVSIKEYLPGLIKEIIDNFLNRKNIQIESSIDDFTLEVQTLVPIGIIVNELLTNTMKYAFTGRERGLIKISAELTNGKVVMKIEDDGVGIPETVTFENSSGFGMQLVGMLTEQINGSIMIERGSGTRFVLEFTV